MPEGGELQVKSFMEPVSETTQRVGERPTDFFKPGESVAVIEITDTGSGIPEDKIEKIFEPFFTTKSKGSGTGLGLAIVRSIVEAHRGLIEVSSQPGQGTMFRITLPIRIK